MVSSLIVLHYQLTCVSNDIQQRSFRSLSQTFTYPNHKWPTTVAVYWNKSHIFFSIVSVIVAPKSEILFWQTAIALSPGHEKPDRQTPLIGFP
ncbi:hypothetical protein RRG08_008716 [Elysia crispata]|uniref:Uncharacterized protein n=1 Tax=Elysia crispata TaxID=231223 RepID=A0AAE0XPX8_9GAST|nr:hypothetical protein RRG08_008716 [Elysia crispata]